MEVCLIISLLAAVSSNQRPVLYRIVPEQTAFIGELLALLAFLSALCHLGSRERRREDVLLIVFVQLNALEST